MKNKIQQILLRLNKVYPYKLVEGNVGEYVNKILENAIIIAIYEKSEIAAFIAYYDNDKKVAFLTMLAVDDNFLRKGYGTTLIEAALKLLKKKGIDFFDLKVNSKNKSAIQLYDSFNFKVVDKGEIIKMRLKL